MKIVGEKDQVPAGAIEALARMMLPAIRSYFESVEGKREFAEWQARQSIRQSAPAEKMKLREAS